MSKERAKRRAERLAVLEKRAAERRREAERSAQLRAVKRRLLPRRGRVGRLPPKYTKTQLRGVIGVLVLLIIFAFFAVHSWPLRVAMICLAVVGLPALLTLTFDRSSR